MDLLAYNIVKLHQELRDFVMKLGMDPNFDTSLAATPVGYSFHMVNKDRKGQVIDYPIMLEILRKEDGTVDKEKMLEVVAKEAILLTENLTNAINSY